MVFGATQELDSLLINLEDHGATINQCFVVLRPIGKAIDFLFRFPTGRLILALIIFVSAGMAVMRLFVCKAPALLTLSYLYRCDLALSLINL